MSEPELTNLERAESLFQKAKERGLVNMHFDFVAQEGEEDMTRAELIESRAAAVIPWLEYSEWQSSLSLEEKLTANAMKVYLDLREVANILRYDRLGVITGAVDAPDYKVMVHMAESKLEMILLQAGNYLGRKELAEYIVAKGFAGMLVRDKGQDDD